MNHPVWLLIGNLSYGMCNSRECMGVSGEALHLCTVYKRHILYYKSCENLYQVPIITIVPSYTGKYHSIVAIGIITLAVHL